MLYIRSQHANVFDYHQLHESLPEFHLRKAFLFVFWFPKIINQAVRPDDGDHTTTDIQENNATRLQKLDAR